MDCISCVGFSSELQITSLPVRPANITKTESFSHLCFLLPRNLNFFQVDYVTWHVTYFRLIHVTSFFKLAKSLTLLGPQCHLLFQVDCFTNYFRLIMSPISGWLCHLLQVTVTMSPISGWLCHLFQVTVTMSPISGWPCHLFQVNYVTYFRLTMSPISG
jgi:hypothetical protein